MKKIKITQSQYKKILLHEANLKNRKNINEGEIIEEGLKEIGLAILLGLGALNSAKAQKAAADIDKLGVENVISQAKEVLNDEKTLTKIFPSKSDLDLIKTRAKSLENQFNYLLGQKDAKGYLDQKDAKNAEEINQLLQKGYALTDLKVDVDTIKGDKGKEEIVFHKDTIEFELPNVMEDLFVTAGYELKEGAEGQILNLIDSLEKEGFRVVSANIESSTDAERMPSFVNKNDITGNKELAKRRANAVLNVLKTKIEPSNITVKELPNNGSDIVTDEQFLNAAKKAKQGDKTELINLRKETQDYRYVKINMVLEKQYQDTIRTESKPDEIVEKINAKLTKLTGTFKKKTKIKVCRRPKKLKKGGVWDCFRSGSL
jgi:hypothetical protein